jgi:GNAT superfamily N-acetyltransferase
VIADFPRPGIATIGIVFVGPDHRRVGVARALVSEVEARLTRRGVRRAMAGVHPGNGAALQFFTAMGYADQPAGDQPRVPFVKDILFVKDL